MRYNIDFIGKRRLFYFLSGAILVIAVVSFFLRGLNLGIDFTGGTQLTAKFQKPVTLTSVNTALTDAGVKDFVAQFTGSGNTTVLISMPSVPEAQRTVIWNDLAKKVAPFQTISFTKVTGSFSSQVVQGGVIAVLLASLGIILYMMIRFDLRFAISGIFAVFWDAFVSLGLVALFHFKVNAPFVAGVLTIIGYSINDRIIIFDRIRENLQKRQKESLKEIVNLSLNQTLGRSINTATVVILAMLAILILGGETTKDLAATVVIGVVFGAYSSILLASPIWFDWLDRVETAAAEKRRTTGGRRLEKVEKTDKPKAQEKDRVQAEAASQAAPRTPRQPRPDRPKRKGKKRR